jgi:hypothetical protein
VNQNQHFLETIHRPVLVTNIECFSPHATVITHPSCCTCSVAAAHIDGP